MRASLLSHCIGSVKRPLRVGFEALVLVGFVDDGDCGDCGVVMVWEE